MIAVINLHTSCSIKQRLQSSLMKSVILCFVDGCICRQYGPNGSYPLIPSMQSSNASVYINRWLHLLYIYPVRDWAFLVNGLYLRPATQRFRQLYYFHIWVNDKNIDSSTFIIPAALFSGLFVPHDRGLVSNLNGADPFLELSNPSQDAVDISGWTLNGAATFKFKAGKGSAAAQNLLLKVLNLFLF
jgi:hypothetical protein